MTYEEEKKDKAVFVDGESYRIGGKAFDHGDKPILPAPEVSADGYTYRIGGRLFGSDGKIICMNLKL